MKTKILTSEILNAAVLLSLQSTDTSPFYGIFDGDVLLSFGGRRLFATPQAARAQLTRHISGMLNQSSYRSPILEDSKYRKKDSPETVSAITILKGEKININFFKKETREIRDEMLNILDIRRV